MKIALLALLAACTSGQAYDSSESAIVGGTRSTGMTSTVMVVAYPTNESTFYTCTGVVLASHVVLTAAHCVDHPGFVFGVFTGDDPTPFTASATTLKTHLMPVTATHIEPDYSTVSPFVADIAVVLTVDPIPVMPAAFQRGLLTSAATGMPATIIGYGQITPGTNNYARYETTTVIGALEADTVIVGDDTKHGCLGDSGGPAFLDTTVIGIDSYGPPNCTGASHYRRTDSYVGFISGFVDPPYDDTPVDPPHYGDDTPVASGGGGGGCGGCSAGGSAGSAAILLFALVIPRRRRR